ncbi:hypothetical protein AAMO2058_000070400 [Amorphochlora amoebiformis]
MASKTEAKEVARIPMSLHVEQSAVIEYPLEKVWELVRPCDFKFIPTVVGVEDLDKKESADGRVGAMRKILYKCGTEQTIKVMELSDLQHSVTYDIIFSKPAVKFTSAIYTIKLQRVSETNSTFMSWSTDFSNDAEEAVVMDSKFKKLEAFKSLRAFMSDSRKILLYRHLSEPTRYPHPDKPAEKSEAVGEGKPELD